MLGSKFEVSLLKLNLFDQGAELHRGSILASHPAALGLIPSAPNFLRRKIIDVTEVNQGGWFEESGQQLKNVDQTHLVLASGSQYNTKII